jgi:hypothetical protein
VAGGWRRLFNEELCNLYASPNIIRVMKSRRMKWAGYVARMGWRRKAYKMFAGKLERDYSEGMDISGNIMLE